MRLRVISLYPLGTLLALLFAPAAAVEWLNTLFDLHDTSVYFVFAAYSVTRAAFGNYDATGFGPFSIQTIVALIAVAAVVRIIVVIIAAMVTSRNTGPRVAALASVVTSGAEVILPSIILLHPSTTSFSIVSIVPVPLVSVFSLAVCLALTFRPSLLDSILDIGRSSEKEA